jgi:hypothetical protein
VLPGGQEAPAFDRLSGGPIEDRVSAAVRDVDGSRFAVGVDHDSEHHSAFEAQTTGFAWIAWRSIVETGCGVAGSLLAGLAGKGSELRRLGFDGFAVTWCWRGRRI